jgi:hypothetical protein
VITGMDDFIGSRFLLGDCYPNPVRERTVINFKTNNTGHVTIKLYDQTGKVVKILTDQLYEPGDHKLEAELSHLPNGNYNYQLKSGFFKDSRALIILK